MQLLRSPTRDYALTGTAGVGSAVPLLVLGFAYAPAVAGLLGFAFATICFGTFMWRFAVRRQIVAATAQVAPGPALERESRGASLRRAFTFAVCQVAFLVLIGFIPRVTSLAEDTTFSMLAGFAAGMGMANLLAARWLQAWERERGALLGSDASLLQWPWRLKRTATWSTRAVVCEDAA